MWKYFVIVIILILLPVIAFSQDSLNVRCVGRMPGSFYESVELIDNVCYIACTHPSMCAYLRTADISNPREPIRTGFYEVCDAGFHDLSVDSKYAYIVDALWSAEIINISDPDSMYLVSRIPTPEGCSGVFFYENSCFLCCGTAGVLIYDVEDPASPVLSGAFNTDGAAHDLFVRDNLAFVAEDSSGLIILDITDHAHIEMLGSCNTPGGALSVYVEGNYAYIADGSAGLRIIDVSDLSSLLEVGSLLTGGYAAETCVSGNYAYLSDCFDGLRVVDISDPYNPIEVGFYINDNMICDTYIRDDYAYVAGGDDGLLILDISHFTGIEEEEEEEATTKPKDFSLNVYPNPFNSSVKLAVVGVLNLTPFHIEIYDISGRLVEKLESPSVGELKCPGSPDHWVTGSPSFSWTPDESVSSGIYLVRAKVGKESITKRVVYLK